MDEEEKEWGGSTQEEEKFCYIYCEVLDS